MKGLSFSQWLYLTTAAALILCDEPSSYGSDDLRDLQDFRSTISSLHKNISYSTPAQKLAEELTTELHDVQKEDRREVLKLTSYAQVLKEAHNYQFSKDLEEALSKEASNNSLYALLQERLIRFPKKIDRAQTELGRCLGTLEGIDGPQTMAQFQHALKGIKKALRMVDKYYKKLSTLPLEYGIRNKQIVDGIKEQSLNMRGLYLLKQAKLLELQSYFKCLRLTLELREQKFQSLVDPQLSHYLPQDLKENPQSYLAQQVALYIFKERDRDIFEVIEEYKAALSISKSHEADSTSIDETLKVLEFKRDWIQIQFHNVLASIKQESLKAPKCFISYAPEEDVREWIGKKLAYELREKAGIKILFDEWALKPNMDIRDFGLKIARTPFIIVVGTPLYKQKEITYRAANQFSNVGTQAELLACFFDHIKNNLEGRVIVALRKGSAEESIPDKFRSGVPLNYTSNNSEYFENTLRLVSTCYGKSEEAQLELVDQFKGAIKEIQERVLTTQEHAQVEEWRKNEIVKKKGIQLPPSSPDTTSPSCYGQPPIKNVLFVGRERELETLVNTFVKGNYGVVALTSDLRLPIGKTELASAYLYGRGFVNQDSQEGFYKQVFWIEASSKERLDQHYAALAQKLELPAEENAPMTVSFKRYLESKKEWLLILDNALDEKSLRPYLPTQGGHVLITSRQPRWRNTDTITLPIDVLTEDEAVDLLIQVSKKDLRGEGIEQLAQELDYLPTALRDAGILLRENNLQMLPVLKEEELKRNEKYLHNPNNPRSNIAPRNWKFTGRELPLRLLEDQFKANTRGPIILAANTGLGGVGKTQIALQYAYRNAQKYDLVWWFKAEQPSTLLQGYEELAEHLGVILTDEDKKQNKVIEKVLDYLCRQHPRWLFVFDNATTQETLGPYLPKVGGDVLITSRNKDNWEDIGNVFDVSVFKPQESVKYLSTVIGKEDADFKTEALKLAEELGHLPLALAQAAAYIKETRTPIAAYYNLFTQKRKTLWRFEGAPTKDNYQFTVNVTWNLSMEKIKEEEALDFSKELCPPLTTEFLNICAYLAPDDIPRQWLRDWVQAKHTQYADSATFIENRVNSRLHKYSMINLDSTGEYLSIHRLVQTVTQDRIHSSNKKKWYVEEVIKLICTTWEYYDSKRLETWKVGRKALPHSYVATQHGKKEDIVIKPLGKIYLCVGEYENQEARYGLAQKADEDALKLFQTLYGDNHPLVGSSLNHLGLVYQTLGEYAEAIENYEQALQIWRSVYGENHPKVVTSLNNLGEVHRVSGENPKALEYFKQALNNYNEAESKHPSVLATCLSNLGLVYHDLGEYTKAIEHSEQALQVFKVLYDENHPDVAMILNNLGSSYDAQGEYVKALKYHNQALQTRKAIYGENHPHVAMSLDNLSSVYHTLGKHNEAIEHSGQALRILTTIYGVNHPDVAMSMNNLGAIHHTLGEDTKALKYHKQALQIRKTIYVKHHPHIAMSLNNLGATYCALGKYKKSLEHYEQALQIWKANYGENHSEVANTLNNIGYFYQAQGEYTKALEYHEQAFRICKVIYDENHPGIAGSLNNLGEAHRALGEHLKAIKHYRQALRIFKTAYGEIHPNIAITLNNLGAAYCDLDLYPEALEHYKQAFSIFKTIYGDNHLNIVTSLNNLGVIHHLLGEPIKAIEYLGKALKILRAAHGENHPHIAMSLNSLGEIHHDLGEYAKALEYHNQALSIFKTLFGEDHPFVVSTEDKLKEIVESNRGQGRS